MDEITQLNESLFNFSLSTILAGFIYGVIGIWLFRQGKRQGNLYFVVIATVLMIYPMFTSTPLMDWGIGALLCAAAYYFRNS